ncbi:SusC/RagA family TonB-linked outer membrane protein [Pseudofulvibacter geojedonensis]|uniref:SusC/RagA family TonB-linked outer membrane protein n=1 Tax=Pseudofulvibacter geojedonensis TaxID=1123758 RepID=A0ABW3I5Z9_9FLAO
MKTKFNGILTLLLAFVVQLTFAQEQTVSGTVLDENSLPLPGATVLIKGTTNGTSTDFDGKYSIKAKNGDTLEFSYVGYATQVIVVNGTSINATLTPDNELDEIVVTAYGTQKKEAITGSVAVISSEELGQVQSANVVQGLEGKVAGVQIVQQAGQPGAAPTVRFRGIGSISSSSAPLYVVNGVPYSGNINAINPQDIESTTFLKDAAAAALYGNRGANGVIIITTKKGKTDKLSVTVDNRVGFNRRSAEDYEMIDSSSDYLRAHYQNLRNGFVVDQGMPIQTASNLAATNLITNVDDLGTNVFPANPINYNPYDVAGNLLIDPNTGQFNPNANLLYNEDWDDYLFKNNITTQSYISVAKASKDSDFLLSLGYEDNDGYVINSGFQRVTAQLNTNTNLTDNLKVGGNLRYANTKQNNVDGDGTGSYSNPLSWSRSIAPIYPVFARDVNGNMILNQNGNPQYDDGTGTIAPSTRPYGQLQNPVATALLDKNERVTDNVSGQGYFDFKFWNDFKFTYNLSTDLIQSNNNTLDTPLYGDAVTANGRVSASNSRTFSFTNQQLLNWNKEINKHSIAVLLGHESMDYEFSFLTGNKFNILLPNNDALDLGAETDTPAGGGKRFYSLEGYFSRLSYDYDNRYYINGSLRRDASSVFHPDNRWGTFFGIGGAWRVSQESFMDSADWLNELKLKASYGEQGNDGLLLPTGGRNYYPYQDQYIVPQGTGQLGVQLSTLGNKDITWETNRNFNVGFETRFLDNRISIEAEYFTRKVSDMLFLTPRAGSAGGRPFPENVADMENVGYEITLGVDILRNKDYNLSFNANTTHVKNEVTKLFGESSDIITNNQFPFALQVGQGRYDFYLREFAGVNPANGNALYYVNDPTNLDVNGNMVVEVTEDIGAAQQVFSGKSALPDFYGGFSFNGNYKNIDFGVDFSYQIGGYGMDNVYWRAFNPEQGGNFHSDVLGSTWTPENTTASLPRVTYSHPTNYAASDLRLIDASYLSLQNISLGYTLPNKYTKILGLESIRFYGLANNVKLWSKRKGYDPRLSLTGTSSNEYSILSTTTFGLTVKF